MNNTSLIVWAIFVLLSFVGTVVFILRSEKTSSFGLGRKIAGSAAATIALAVLLLPVLFLPALGPIGILLSFAGIGFVVISAWKWWVFWIPLP